MLLPTLDTISVYTGCPRTSGRDQKIGVPGASPEGYIYAFQAALAACSLFHHGSVRTSSLHQSRNFGMLSGKGTSIPTQAFTAYYLLSPGGRHMGYSLNVPILLRKRGQYIPWWLIMSESLRRKSIIYIYQILVLWPLSCAILITQQVSYFPRKSPGSRSLGAPHHHRRLSAGRWKTQWRLGDTRAELSGTAYR